MPDEFELLAEMDFDVDADEADRAAVEVLDDESLELLRRANRVGLSRGTPVPVEGADVPPGRAVYDVPLTFVLHAHPDCTFQWSRLVVDLSPTGDAMIADMAPRGVEDVPVEVETSLGLGLKFAVASKVANVEAKPELARKRTVYFPTLTSSGTGFHKGYWDFFAKAGDYLHADKELRLLVDTPAGRPVQAAVTVRAKVRFRGLARLIPLLAKTAQHDRVVTLAP